MWWLYIHTYIYIYIYLFRISTIFALARKHLSKHKHVHDFVWQRTITKKCETVIVCMLNAHRRGPNMRTKVFQISHFFNVCENTYLKLWAHAWLCLTENCPQKMRSCHCMPVVWDPGCELIYSQHEYKTKIWKFTIVTTLKHSKKEMDPGSM